MPPKLFEREDALRQLAKTAARIRTGGGVSLYLAGEAGIGKTALLSQFASEIDPGTTVLWGGCEALFTARPLGPLYDIAQAVDPAILDLLHLGASQERIFPAVLAALQARINPLVIVFEDIHWADNATLDLIKYLGRRVSQLRVLLILSGRSDEIGQDHPAETVIGDLIAVGMARLDLHPLSAATVDMLAKDVGLSGSAVYKVTSGNPFFVTEVIANGLASAVPTSIRDAVWARVLRLTKAEQATLELMALFPGGAEARLVAPIAGPDSDALIESIAAQGLGLVDQNGTFRFRHELARLATLARITPLRQKRLHAGILATMEEAVPAVTISRQAHHAEAAQDFATLLELAPRAAQKAAQMGAHLQAARHLHTALQYAVGADPVQAAQLHQDWAYESGLAVGINDDIIAARETAVTLWQQLDRPDKIAHNYRWLSRMHWYRGESKLASDYIDAATLALEGLPPNAELAWAYSAASQMHMLHDRTDDAINWGDRAIALAEQLGETEVLIHALNNVASARMFSGRDGGEPLMQKSLSLALEHGFHEQAARAYTNMSDYAVCQRKFDLAEQIFAEGIAFDTQNDLDSWTHYLIGRKAQLRMEQGFLSDAQTMATSIIAIDRLTLVMKLPARQVLAKCASRLGATEAPALLDAALADALRTDEAQNICPARLAMAEAAWIADDLATCIEHLTALCLLDTAAFDPWELGELSVWLKRAGLDPNKKIPGAVVAAPYAAELRDDPVSAADQWEKLGLPFEAGLALLQTKNIDGLGRAATLLEGIRARPAALRARHKAKSAGLTEKMPKRKRGPYKASRAHPMGLSKRENEVLGLVAVGLTNLEISQQLGRSERTVEHHVSSVLAKIGAGNRMDIMLRLRHEPWMLQAAE